MATGAAARVVPVTADLSLSAEGENFELSRVNPRFTRALGIYSAKLESLDAAMGREREAQIPRALELLADTIEQIPHAPPEAAVGKMAARIKETRPSSVIGMQVGGVEMKRTKEALSYAARTLRYLANTTYRDDPEVMERVREMEAAVREMEEEQVMSSPSARTVEALRQAGMVLAEMHTAVARGIVR